MDTKRKIILHKLGFNVNSRSAEFFSDIVSEVMPDIENNSTSDKINQKIDVSYVEFGHFVYEIGINRFKDEVKNFHSNRDMSIIDSNLYREVYGENYTPTINESIKAIASYLVKIKEIVELPKVLVK